MLTARLPLSFGAAREIFDFVIAEPAVSLAPGKHGVGHFVGCPCATLSMEFAALSLWEREIADKAKIACPAK
jgi:hypothetical protein